MTNKNHRVVSRRRFLLGTGGLAFSLLTGCGGSGGGSATTPPTEPTSVTVLTVQVGPGTFSATTEYQAKSPLSSGTGTVVTSNTDVHHVFLTDGGGVLRGMALAQPKTQVTIGAESSLLAGLFLVTGILTRDATAAPARIAALKALASYPAALAYITKQLPTVTLQALTQDPTYNVLCLAVARDFIANYKGRGIINIGEPVDFFSLSFTGASTPANPAAVSITMSNTAWRNLRVDRVLMDASGAVTKTQAVKDFPGQMGGGVGVSYGAIFSGTIGNPDVEPDPSPIDFTQSAHAQYWVQGPGFKPGASPPPSISTDDSAAWGSSAVEYMVFPLISMLITISGSFPGASGIVQMADTVWDSVNDSADVQALTSATDDSSRQTAAKNLLIDSLTTGLDDGAFVAAGLLSAVEAEVLGGLLGLIGLGLGIFTVALVLDQWGGYTRRESIQIDSLGGGVVTIQ